MSGDPGIGPNNYDYLQHTTIHPQQNAPPMYYSQQSQDPHPNSYAGDHHQHQYYQTPMNQQQYYQQPSQEGLTQQQAPWPANENMHGYYQQPQHYHQNQNYQQPPPPHPPIHQLSSFVGHGHDHNPMSPSSSHPPTPISYPSASTPSAGYVPQASPSLPQQRALSPVRPGPGSSPGAAANHMMPVRLQNMANGARTKAGMRKLMQMQEQHGQNSSFDPPPKTPPVTQKTTKAKKSGSSPLKAEQEAPTNNASVSSVEQSIEAVVFSALPTKSTKKAVDNTTIRAKTPPAAAASRNEQVIQVPMAAKVKQALLSQNPSTGLSNETKSATITSPRFTIENSDPFFHGAVPYLPQFRNPTPSDLLFEKLGLDKEEPKKARTPGKNTATPSPKKRRNSSPANDEISQSKTKAPVLDRGSTSPKRTRRSLSGSTSGEPEPKSSQPLTSNPTPTLKRKYVKKAKSLEGSTMKTVAGTQKLNPVPIKSPTDARKGQKENPKLKTIGLKTAKRQGSKSPQKGTEDVESVEASIAEVAAKVVSSSPTVGSKVLTKTEVQIPEVRTKRKYTKRNPALKKFKSILTKKQLAPQVKHKKRIPEQTKSSVILPLEVSVIPIHAKQVTQTGKSLQKAKSVEARKRLPTGTKKKKKTSELETAEPSVLPPSKPLISVSNEIVGSADWIDKVMEKRSNQTMKMKKPTVWSKPNHIGQVSGIEGKKEPGPSLKVKHGVVKFYRGSMEEDVDEALKKLEVVLKDTVTRECEEDTDTPWVCIFCGLGPHDMRLGDLFGPYFVDESSGKKFGASLKKEVWLHTDCALWAGDVILVGSTLRNLDEAVYEAGKVTCNICRNVGATIGCLKRGCKETAHFPCAKLNDWSLNGDTFHSHCKVHLSNIL